MKSLLFLLVALIAAAPIVAQTKGGRVQETWISSLTPGDAAHVGWAVTNPPGDLAFSCGRTAVGGPYETHLAHPAFPYGVTLRMHHAALGTGAAGQPRDDLSVRVDGIIYTLPTVWFHPDTRSPMWYVHLSMGDALFADLLDGGDFELRQAGQPVALHRGAMGTALAEAIGFCLAQHGAIGLPLPDHARAVATRLPAPAARPVSDPEARMTAAISRAYAARYTLDPASVERPDLDHDGVPDAVLFWGGVACHAGPNAGPVGAGVCGASQCLTSFFLSGSAAQGPDAEIYFAGILTDPARPGQIGMVSRLAACRHLALGPECTQWGDWAGGALRILP